MIKREDSEVVGSITGVQDDLTTGEMKKSVHPFMNNCTYTPNKVNQLFLLVAIDYTVVIVCVSNASEYFNNCLYLFYHSSWKTNFLLVCAHSCRSPFKQN